MTANESRPAGAASGVIVASETSIAHSSRPGPRSRVAFRVTDAYAACVPPCAGRTMAAEDRRAAFNAGYEQGKAERLEVEIEDRVLARLHDQALQTLGMARTYAGSKGPEWSAMVTGEDQ